MAAQGIILKNASGASQGIGPGFNAGGNIVPTLISLPLATLVELRVISNLLNTTNLDLNTMRADELNNACLPGEL